MRFRVEPARSDQVDALCAIERAAVQLFRGHRAWASYVAMAIPPALLLRAITRGLVWVAPDATGALVGFVWLDTDLPPAHRHCRDRRFAEYGRRGIGAALLEHACDWARAAGYRRVDLGTLADVRWNAPFYAQHGFVDGRQGGAGFALARQRDARNGFPADLRVFMRRQLSPPARRRMDGVARAGQAQSVPAYHGSARRRLSPAADGVPPARLGR